MSGPVLLALALLVLDFWILWQAPRTLTLAQEERLLRAQGR